MTVALTPQAQARLDTLVALHRQIDRQLRQFVDSPLRGSFDGVSIDIAKDVVAAYVTRPSKHFVGLLFLQTYGAFVPGARLDASELMSVATAIELRHAAILLHDDIVDEDEQRGSTRTAHRALEGRWFSHKESFGAALFLGDVLFGLASYPILHSGLSPELIVRVLDRFNAYTARTSVGQAEQLYLDTMVPLADLSEDRILDVHALHMGATTVECSMTLAALVAGASPDELDALGEAGRHLSAVFQVQNDLAGFRELGRQLAAGDARPVALANISDLARRRRTLVVHAAAARLPAIEATRLTRFIQGEDADLDDIVALVERSGAEAYVDAFLARRFQEAGDRLLTDRRLSAATRERLRSVVVFMTDLYDPSSELDRLQVYARPELQPR